MEKVFYVYVDQNSQKYYYFDTKTNLTSFTRPKEGRLLDPVTQKKYKFPKTESEHSDPNPGTEPPTEPAPLVESDSSKSKKSSKHRVSIKSSSSEQPSNQTNKSRRQSAKVQTFATIPAPNDVIGSLDGKHTYPKKSRHSKIKDEFVTSTLEDSRNEAPIVVFQPPQVESEDLIAKVETDDHPETKMLDIPLTVVNYEPSAGPIIQREASFIPGEDGKMPSLPEDLQNDIHKFQIEEFAQKYFRQRRSKTFFNRKQVSIDDLTNFSLEPITKPLLTSLNEKDSKTAIKLFQYILSYTTDSKSKSSDSYAEKIVNICSENPVLRDEVYFQLIKQTRTNDKPDILIRTWELFLIMATYFPSTHDSMMWILKHLCQNCKSDIPEVSVYAKFTYIRFSARCADGQPFQTNEIGFIQKIPKHPFNSQQKFGSSIYEQLWIQKETYPKLPIPIFIYTVTQELLSRNCQEHPGILRVGGNVRLICSFAEKIDKGENVDWESLNVNDVSSLMKKWVRDLPDPIIPVSKTQELITAAEDKNFIGFADSLPHAHRSVLKFMVGFLREITKKQDVNKMNEFNVGVCIGPNIIKTPANMEPRQVSVYSEYSSNFLSCLLSSNWDVSEVYPIDPNLLLK